MKITNKDFYQRYAKAMLDIERALAMFHGEDEE